MLKLKIGKNFLLLNYVEEQTKYIDATIPYMMGCFKGEGQIAAIGLIEMYNKTEWVRAIQEGRHSRLFLLVPTDYLLIKQKENAYVVRDFKRAMSMGLSKIIKELKAEIPALDIKVININAYYQQGEYRLAKELYKILKEDPNNILSALPKLEMYKQMSQRLTSIPKEIKIVDNDIKRLSKEKRICDRKITLQSIDYLHLIKQAKISGTDLSLTINPLPIYPSEELGMVFTEHNFRSNPYLFKAASYIYQGCHFQMPETQIVIHGGDFRPEFIKTNDNRWDDMFSSVNWSTIGYPHFGINHFCGGEFNDTIAHAKEYGLDYYFISLKQYLTTANMRDTAGFRVWWYPIYSPEGELVYCAGMDIAIEEFIKPNNPTFYNELKAMTWEEKATCLNGRINYRESSIQKYGHGGLSYYGGPPSKDVFIELCKQTNQELYNKIMEGRK